MTAFVHRFEYAFLRLWAEINLEWRSEGINYPFYL